MAIQISRDILGDSSPYIYFKGVTSDGTTATRITNNVSTISIGLNAEDADYIDIIDDDLTFSNTDTTYELYKVHYSEWLDSDGFDFGDADAVVDYINAEITSAITGITGIISLATPRTVNQDLLVVPANTAFTYDATYSNGIGYYWDEATFPAGVEVSRYDQRILIGTITQSGTYVINFEVSNRNGIVAANVNIQVL
jgi:hypothetical protein